MVLRYWEALSVEQVAHVLGCTPGNVQSHTARTLDKLRAALDESMSSYGLADRGPERRHEMGDGRHG